ncbi:MAG TPA: hypothetical protein VFH47_06510 [Candidatus Thermoplasmatota archaeon]|nr:hypothetical protein [Candidatus Thermoplasmatota archaeon]
MALFALVLLFGVLAFLVRRKLRGARPDPKALEEDARQRASVSQRP